MKSYFIRGTQCQIPRDVLSTLHRNLETVGECREGADLAKLASHLVEVRWIHGCPFPGVSLRSNPGNIRAALRAAVSDAGGVLEISPE